MAFGSKCLLSFTLPLLASGVCIEASFCKEPRGKTAVNTFAKACQVKNFSFVNRCGADIVLKDWDVVVPAGTSYQATEGVCVGVKAPARSCASFMAGHEEKVVEPSEVGHHCDATAVKSCTSKPVNGGSPGVTLMAHGTRTS